MKKFGFENECAGSKEIFASALAARPPRLCGEAPANTLATDTHCNRRAITNFHGISHRTANRVGRELDGRPTFVDVRFSSQLEDRAFGGWRFSQRELLASNTLAGFQNSEAARVEAIGLRPHDRWRAKPDDQRKSMECGTDAHKRDKIAMALFRKSSFSRASVNRISIPHDILCGQ